MMEEKGETHNTAAALRKRQETWLNLHYFFQTDNKEQQDQEREGLLQCLEKQPWLWELCQKLSWYNSPPVRPRRGFFTLFLEMWDGPSLPLRIGNHIFTLRDRLDAGIQCEIPLGAFAWGADEGCREDTIREGRVQRMLEWYFIESGLLEAKSDDTYQTAESHAKYIAGRGFHFRTFWLHYCNDVRGARPEEVAAFYASFSRALGGGVSAPASGSIGYSSPMGYF